MADIHRLLCTHCTFGTSELESSSAENAGKVLGYSVRKSSLPDAERGQLRQVFRAVERLLSYGLPKDATAAHKETLSADTAPRRLIFFPNLGGWQVAGQVSYRTFDTSQPPRPGSYFADLLVAKAPDPRSRDPQPAWSPGDVLQLWSVGPDRKTRDQAGWWISSEAELVAAESEGPWKPISPTSVTAVREPRPPLIDDDAAHRFLASDGVAADPLVPDRWWAMPAERRRELVAQMLQATIQGPARGGRETVTIAAEPSVAAVLFYIVCRLLPRRIAAGVSFSTYEPAPERPLTGLVATTFLNEEAPTADLPPELAQRGFACNTFRADFNYGRCQPPPEHGYARRLVALAAADDWVGIDSLLAALDAEGLKAADLDELIKIDHLLTAYVRGKIPAAKLSVRRGPQEARFLRERFRGVLEMQAATRADWPSDLLEAAIFCLDGELENLWTAGGPARALLERHLPDSEGLARLLKPPKDMPSPPQTLLVPAVVSATIRRKPSHLPSSFVRYCAAASAGRDREAAKALLGEVIRGLPEERRIDALVGDEDKSASLADLLLDVARGLTPPERDGLRPALTESLSNALKKLTTVDPDAAAELLARQADATAWIAAGHDGLQEQIRKFFHDVLNPNDGNHSGRHLVDSAGRSLVAALQKWTDHARDRGQIAQLLALWKDLHDAVARLAANAPPWRSWAKPASPEGSELAAAVEAIDRLRPFGPSPNTDAKNQKMLAEAVNDAFKNTLPQGDDRRARWKTVGHWLDRALEKEAGRRASKPKHAAPDRSPAVMYSVFASIAAALIAVVVGIVSYSQGQRLEPGPNAGVARKEVKETDTAGPNKLKPQGGSESIDPPVDAPIARPLTPTTASEPAALPPADIGLKARLANGTLCVTWNHEKLKPRSSDIKLTWSTGKNPSHQEMRPSVPGKAEIDTTACGFGKYEVTLAIGSEAKYSVEETIFAPDTKLKDNPSLEIMDGQPHLLCSLSIDSTMEARYGPVSIRLCGPENFSESKAAPDGKVSFKLPDSVKPENYESLLQQFDLATVVPQGVGPTQTFTAPPRPDAKQSLLKTLQDKQHITALPDQPAEDALTLSSLPWSLGPEQFDLWLMTPEFKPGISLMLGPKDTNSKTLRWPCKATVGAESGDLTVGHFELEAPSAWEPRLQFKPAGAREKGYDAAYAALRYCRLGLVIDGQPVATCQLVGRSTLGPLTIKFPVSSKPISTTLEGVGWALGSLEHVSHPRLTRTGTKPEPIKHDKLELSLETVRGDKPVVKLSDGDFTATAVIQISEGELRLDCKPPVKRATGLEAKRKAVEKRKESITAKENDVGQLRRNLDAAGRENNEQRKLQLQTEVTKLETQISQTKEQIRKDERELEDLQAEDAFAEALQKATFEIPDWRIDWKTTVAQDKSPLPTDEIPGGTDVVFIQGSPAGEPIVFKVREKLDPDGK
jgi:hypothetical protein